MAPKRFFFPAFIWTLGITIASLVSSGSIPNVVIWGKDKLVHAFFYFVFFFLWFQFLSVKFTDLRFKAKLLSVLTASFFYGLIIELLQEVLTATRKADVLDVLANMTGALLAAMILILLKTFRNKNKV